MTRIESCQTIDPPRDFGGRNTNPDFPEIKYGGCYPGQLKRILEQQGMYVNNYGDLFEISLSEKPFETRSLTVAKVTVADLGLNTESTVNEINSRARLAGFELCPDESAAYIRLALNNQPEGEKLFVGMAPLSNKFGSKCIFRIYNDGVLKIAHAFASPNDFFSPSDTFVFAQKR